MGSPFTSTGTCPRRRRVATTSSCSRRSRNNPAPSPTPCAGISSTVGSCWTSSGWTSRSCATSTRCSWWRAGPRITPGWSPSTRSSIGAGCRWKWSSPANSGIATRCWTAPPLSSRSPSPGRQWTPWKRCATPRTRRPGYWRSATPMGRRSPASPTRCSTPTPGRRSGWPPPRRSSRRSSPTSWSAWRWRRLAAPSTPTRWPASSPNSRPSRQRWPRC